MYGSSNVAILLLDAVLVRIPLEVGHLRWIALLSLGSDAGRDSVEQANLCWPPRHSPGFRYVRDSCIFFSCAEGSWSCLVSNFHVLFYGYMYVLVRIGGSALAACLCLAWIMNTTAIFINIHMLGVFVYFSPKVSIPDLLRTNCDHGNFFRNILNSFISWDLF